MFEIVSKLPGSGMLVVHCREATEDRDQAMTNAAFVHAEEKGERDVAVVVDWFRMEAETLERDSLRYIPAGCHSNRGGGRNGG